MVKIKQLNMLRNKDDIYATQIHAILSAVYSHAPWTLEQTISDMRRTDSDYYLALSEDELVIGFLATAVVMNEIEITNLAVAKQYQNQGIAGLLLDQLLNHDGQFFLEVRATNVKARKLYEDKGFESYFVRRNYYQNPLEDAILMKREK